MAGFRRGQMGALGCLGIEAHAEKLSGEVVVGRAGQRRFREHGAALAHHIDVAVADEVGGDEPVDLQGGDVARPAGQIDNGIGSLLRRAGGIFRDHEPDGAAIRPAAILRYHEVEAARFGKLFGPRQFRARRRLEARHLWRTDVLGACHGGTRRGEGRAGGGAGDRQPRCEPSI